MKWAKLIIDAENYCERTGRTIDSVWLHIDREEFAEARELLDELVLMDIEEVSGL